ncbi:MAG: DUF1822 family protein [Xenococcaceae cyanobacterium MO_188.B29]|nr:DUF1822 family protein [Xenococcaceae cyanobacterium MO_188.B29]
MNPREVFPEVATWDINKLICALNAARKRLDNKREISEIYESYLCGILVGYSPKDIGQRLNLQGDGKAIRTAFSTEINPYVREILDYPDDLEGNMNWQRACVLLEKAGYKNHFSPPDSSVIKVKLDTDNPTMTDLEKIIAKIREMTQDKSIKIQDIRKGCIELVLSGSPEGLKRLASLIESGELSEIAGVKIISVESGLEASQVVRLSNWWDNLVESGWSALEQLLSPQQLQLETIRSDELKKGKLIDRTMVEDGFAVILTLKQKPLAEDSVDITLRVYPAVEQMYLPVGLKMRMFARDEEGNEVIIDKQASSSDEWIQLDFTGEPGEEFGVEIAKGDISVIENFVI